MSLFKRFIFAFALLPSLAFADVYEANFDNVSEKCFAAFRISFGMLPYLADELNAHAGVDVLKITNVKIPTDNPSTYSATVTLAEKTQFIGDYQFFQHYTSPSLYLRLDQMPVTLSDRDIDHIWAAMDRFFQKCTI